MTAIANKEPAKPITRPASKPPAQNPAVTRCVKLWNRTYKETPKSGPEVGCDDDFKARQAADKAYYAAMPNLSGIENIRDFIACIAYAMLNGIIYTEIGTKLLYAAQVALATTSKNQDPKTTDSN